MCRRRLEESLTISNRDPEKETVLWQTKKTSQLNQSNYFHKCKRSMKIWEELCMSRSIFEYSPLLKRHTPGTKKTRLKSCSQKPCWFWSTQSWVWAPTNHGSMAWLELDPWILQRLHTSLIITGPLPSLHLKYHLFFFAKHHALLRNSVHHVPVGHLCTLADHQFSRRGPRISDRWIVVTIFGPDAHSATMPHWNQSTGRKSTSAKISIIPRSCFSSFPK